MKSLGYNACALIGGAIIGAAVALLMAPKSGEDTRKMIREFVDDELEKAKKNCRKIHMPE